MVVDNRTAERNYPLPSLANKQREDIPRLVAALEAIGIDVDALFTEVAGKADNGHKHPFDDVIGLQSALEGKSPTDHRHALGSLTDVSVDSATNGMVLKRVGLAWVASRILLGDIEGWEATVAAQVAGAITGLRDGAPGALDTLDELAAALGDDPNFAATIAAALGNRVRGDAAQTWSAGQKLQARNNIGAQADLGYVPVQQGTGVGQLTPNVVKVGWSGAKLKGTVDNTDLGSFAFEGWVATNYLAKTGGTLTGSLEIQQANARVTLHYPTIRIWYFDITTDGSLRCVDQSGGVYGWSINTAGQLSVRGYGWLHEYFATKTEVNDRVRRTGYGDYGESAAVLGAWSKVPAGKFMTGVFQLSNSTISTLASMRPFMDVPSLGGWQWSLAV